MSAFGGKADITQTSENVHLSGSNFFPEFVGEPYRQNYSSCFVDVRRLLADIRQRAKRCGLMSVLNSQAPRLSRCIFHRACACLISAKSANLTSAS
jgi:hypothetical protein